MTRTNKQNPREARSLKRKSFTKDVKQSFLIICEGKNTEPDYFNAFRLTSANIKTIGQGNNTLSLVQKALRIRDDERSRGRHYDQYWVVFDKDDFPDNDFNSAIELARNNKINVAYSNQAFEYWFLLHFSLLQGPMDRKLYIGKLTSLLGFQYRKEQGIGAYIYRELIGRQSQAIKNAKTVMQQMKNISPAQAESSTTVFELVEELNKYID